MRQRGAEKFGVNSTPTFFINGKIQRGALPIDELAKLIDPYLKNG
ncbi:MAG: thioredoxin domain-containing protein [Xanthobacteraceae bacterium]